MKNENYGQYEGYIVLCALGKEGEKCMPQAIVDNIRALLFQRGSIMMLTRHMGNYHKLFVPASPTTPYEDIAPIVSEIHAVAIQHQCAMRGEILYCEVAEEFPHLQFVRAMPVKKPGQPSSAKSNQAPS